MTRSLIVLTLLGVAGGLHHALTEAVRIKANAVALFTKNQRTWKGAPISAEAAAEFRKTMAEVNFDPEMILPHGSYLINLCSPDEGLEKSRLGFLDELKRCEALGIKRCGQGSRPLLFTTSACVAMSVPSLAPLGPCFTDR